MHEVGEVTMAAEFQKIIKMSKRTTAYVLVGVFILFIVIVIVIGFRSPPESTFQLSNESRLPKWTSLPPGLDRDDVSLEMSYYIRPWGSVANFTLRDSKERMLEKLDGKVKCNEPIELRTPLPGVEHVYPSYEVITVNGFAEIIEHKKMEPIFYITDDPIVLKQISAIGCR